MKRIALTVLIAFCTVVFTFHPTHAQTTDAELRAALLQQIAELQALIATLTAQMTPTTYQFTKTDWGSVGAKGESYRQLQRALNSLGYTVAQTGPGAPGSETDYFGPATETALKRFQTDHGIVSFGTPATTGYGALGPQTAERLNAVLREQQTSTAHSTQSDESTNSITTNDGNTTSSGGGSGRSASSDNSSGSAGSTGNASPVQTTPDFLNGDRITVTTGDASDLNVRETPNGTLLGRQTNGVVGTITAVPVTVGNFVWYNVNFDSGVDGWVVQDFVTEYVAPTNTTPTPPPTTPPADPLPGMVDAPAGPYDIGLVPGFLTDLEWPREPITTQTINVSTIAELQSAVETNGARVVVAPGTYNGNLTVRGSNVDVVMAEGATINGEVRIGGGFGQPSRIRWTGGTVLGGPFRLDPVNDVLIDDLYAVTDGNLNNWTAGPVGWHRVALLNSTLEVRNGNSTGDWTIYIGNTNGQGEQIPHHDLIIANSKLISDAQNNRFQGVEDMVVVDSVFNGDLRSANGTRLHHSDTNVFFRDSVIGGSLLVGGSDDDPSLINAVFENVTRYRRQSDLVFHQINNSNENVTVRNSTTFTTTSSRYGEEANVGAATGENNIITNWNGVLPSFDTVGANQGQVTVPDDLEEEVVVSCSSYTYSAWSSCQSNNTQTRTVLSSSPTGCTGGNPTLSQSCVYQAPDSGDENEESALPGVFSIGDSVVFAGPDGSVDVYNSSYSFILRSFDNGTIGVISEGPDMHNGSNWYTVMVGNFGGEVNGDFLESN